MSVCSSKHPYVLCMSVNIVTNLYPYSTQNLRNYASVCVKGFLLLNIKIKLPDIRQDNFNIWYQGYCIVIVEIDFPRLYTYV